jgi:hypothetical protein
MAAPTMPAGNRSQPKRKHPRIHRTEPGSVTEPARVRRGRASDPTPGTGVHSQPTSPTHSGEQRAEPVPYRDARR